MGLRLRGRSEVKRRFWIGFGDYINFSRKDRTLFYVVPADGNAERKLDRAAFVEGDDSDLKAVRDGLVAEIDKWYEHELHMRELNEFSRKKAERLQEEKVKDMQTTSLSIMDIEPKTPPASGELGLLDL